MTAAGPGCYSFRSEAGVSEVFDLSPADQAILAVETDRVAAALKQMSGATKINIAALGNIVAQLHVHVIDRRPGDPC